MTDGKRVHVGMRYKPVFWAIVVLTAAFTLVREQVVAREPAGWDLLREGGLVVLIRHAAAPGFGDPPNFRLGDCTTQRNLSEEGRLQAQAMGEAFRRRKVPIEKVYSSQWCRCKDTAQLAFGAFQEHPALNSFFEQPRLKDPQTEALRAFLMQLRPQRGNLVLVTHQVNITALTGVVPQPGEMVVVALEDDGRPVVKFRLMAAD
jgi:phosphohistidine phosphatase SixA